MVRKFCNEQRSHNCENVALLPLLLRVGKHSRKTDKHTPVTKHLLKNIRNLICVVCYDSKFPSDFYSSGWHALAFSYKTNRNTHLQSCAHMNTQSHTEIHIQYNNDQKDSTGVLVRLRQHRGMQGRNNDADFSAGETGGQSYGMDNLPERQK